MLRLGKFGEIMMMRYIIPFGVKHLGAVTAQIISVLTRLERTLTLQNEN